MNNFLYDDYDKYTIRQLLLYDIVPFQLLSECLEGINFSRDVFVYLMDKYDSYYSFLSDDVKQNAKKLFSHHLENIMQYNGKYYSYFKVMPNKYDEIVARTNYETFLGCIGKIYSRTEKKLNQFLLYQSIVTDLDVFKDGGKRIMEDKVENSGEDQHVTDFGHAIEHLKGTIEEYTNSNFYKGADTPNIVVDAVTDFVDKYTNEMTKNTGNSRNEHTGTDKDTHTGQDTLTKKYGKNTNDNIKVDMLETFENVYSNITKLRDSIVSDMCDVVLDEITFPLFNNYD